MSLPSYPVTGSNNFESFFREASEIRRVAIEAKAPANHTHGEGGTLFSNVADEASLGTGATAGEIRITANGNLYSWDDGNSKWRIARAGNIYANADLPSSSTYTIQTGIKALDTDAMEEVVWDGSQWSLNLIQFIPIEWPKAGATPPADVDELTNSNQTVPVRDFDGTAQDEDVVFSVPVPRGVQTEKVKFRWYAWVSNATGPSSEGVRYELAGHVGALGASLGTGIGVSKTGITASQYDQIVSDWSGDVTITSLSTGKIAVFNFKRDYDHTDDSYNQDLGGYGIDILWQ